MNTQPYAPTPYGLNTVNPNINYDTEIKLYDNTKERELYESLAELYSIIVTLDVVEKAYIRDTVSQHEYTQTCLRLIAQYNTILKNEDVAVEFDNIDSFKQKYNMNHPHATSRLKIGVPATVEHSIESSAAKSAASPASSSTNISAKAVAEATGNFITTMDGIKLSFRAKDQVHPLLGELIKSLNAVTNENFEGRGALVQWLITLNKMRANEELSDEQSRNLMFDLNQAYNAFVKILE